MGLFGSRYLRDLETEVQVGLSHFQMVSLGSSDPGILEEVVWTDSLSRAQEAARLCLTDGSERAMRRVITTSTKGFLPHISPDLQDEALRWVEAIYP